MDKKDFNLTKAAYSIREAAEIVPFGRTKLTEDIASGKLEAVRNGKSVVITAPALVQYLESMPPHKPKAP
ncbi:MAG: helix-turn-helix domain-containing protein [Methylocella sp.]